jgi:hypothetical protein
MEIHTASAVNAQVQSRAVELATGPAPPAGPKDDGLVVTPNWHLSERGATTDVDEELQRTNSNARASANHSAVP